MATGMSRPDHVSADEGMRPPTPARTARRGALRTVVWIAVVAVLGAAVFVGIAKSRGHADDAHDEPGVVATNSKALVTFDDRGLRVSPATAHAGIIEMAFVDARREPSGSQAQLFYEDQPNVNGDLIAGPGGRPRVLFCAHRYYLVVRVNGVVRSRVPFDVTGKSPYCAA